MMFSALSVADSAPFAPRSSSVATDAAAPSSPAQLDLAARIALIASLSVAAFVLALGLLVFRARRRHRRTLATLQRTMGTTDVIANRRTFVPPAASSASSFVADKLDDRRSRTDMSFASRTLVESTAAPSVAARPRSPTAFSSDDPFWMSHDARTSYGSEPDMFAVP